jgi:hypothetical protein
MESLVLSLTNKRSPASSPTTALSPNGNFRGKLKSRMNQWKRPRTGGDGMEEDSLRV